MRTTGPVPGSIASPESEITSTFAGIVADACWKTVVKWRVRRVGCTRTISKRARGDARVISRPRTGVRFRRTTAFPWRVMRTGSALAGSDDVRELSAVTAGAGLDPVSVSFGAIPSGSGQTKTFAVALTNLSGGTLTVAASVTPGDPSVTYAVSPAQVQLAPGETKTLTVTMSAAKAAAAGHHQGQLNITAGGTSVAHAAVYTLIK